MFRNDDPTAVPAMPALQPAGAEGFWTAGNALTGQAATVMIEDFFNIMQEELRNPVVAKGDTPTKTNMRQLLAAMLYLRHGRCTVVVNSTTQIAVKPMDGNGLIVNGAGYVLPAAGLIGNTTAVRVNGTPGQNLAAATVYYVYAMDDGTGALVLDFWSGANAGHMTDTTAGNVGIEVRNNGGTPDSTRTLLAMLLTDGSIHFNDTPILRTVRSWFDRRRKSLVGPSETSSTTSATVVEANTAGRVSACLWAGEAISLGTYGTLTSAAANWSAIVTLGVDGAVAVQYGNSVTSVANNASGANAMIVADGTLAEGAHNFNAFFASNGSATVTLSSLIQGTVGG